MDDLFESIPDNWDNREKADEQFWKDIEKIPAFTTGINLNEDLSHDLEALQAVKFDEDTPYDTAQNYKDEGNLYFKSKNYVLAKDNYSRALKFDFEDNVLKAMLFTNRATCEYQLKNYRKCINDCLQAIKVNPNHIKAYFRAAKAALEIKKFKEGLDYCQEALNIVSDNKELLELVKELNNKFENLKIIESKLDNEDEMRIFLKKRGIVFKSGPSNVDIPATHLSHPIINSDQTITFNILLLYPEYKQTDYLKEVSESVTLADCLRSVFTMEGGTVDWDVNKTYQLFTPKFKSALEAYIEDDDNNMINISLSTTLKELLIHSSFKLRPDYVIEFNVVSVLSDTFYKQWKLDNTFVDLD